MARAAKQTMKIAGIILATMMVLSGAALLVLQSPMVQRRMNAYATAALADKLETHVKVGQARLNLFERRVQLSDVEIDDRQGNDLFRLDRLDVGIALLPLLHNEINVKKASIKGLHAKLLKPSTHDPANYQFVIDALKSNRPKRKKKTRINIDVEKLMIEDNSVVYNDDAFTLKRLFFRKGNTGRLEDLQTRRMVVTQQGDTVTHSMSVGRAAFSMHERGSNLLTARDIHYSTHSNAVSDEQKSLPDARHLDVEAELRMAFSYLDIDSVDAAIQKLNVTDRASGFHADVSRLHLSCNQQTFRVAGLTMSFGNNKDLVGDLSLSQALYEKHKGGQAEHIMARLENSGAVPTDDRIEVARIGFTENRRSKLFDIAGLQYIRNGQHRQTRHNRTGMPDFSNFHLTANIKASVEQETRHSQRISINECRAVEHHSGMRLTEVKMKATTGGATTRVSDLTIAAENPDARMKGNVSLESLILRRDSTGTLKNLAAAWMLPQQRGQGRAQVAFGDVIDLGNRWLLNLSGIRYASDATSRGIDVTASAQMRLMKDMSEHIRADILHIEATDRPSGLRLNDLNAALTLDRQKATLDRPAARWCMNTKGLPTDHSARAEQLVVTNDAGRRHKILLRGLHYTTDNHQAMKAASPDKRRAPDVGHLDLTADALLQVNSAEKGTIYIRVDRLRAREKHSHIAVEQLSANITGGRRAFTFSPLSARITWETANGRRDGGLDINADVNARLATTPDGQLSADIKSAKIVEHITGMHVTQLAGKLERDKQQAHVSGLQLMLNNTARNTHAQCTIDDLVLRKDFTGGLRHLTARWNAHTKNGEVDNELSAANISMQPRGAAKQLTMQALRFTTDNHQPRKNAGKPKRGFFDVTHLDLNADLLFDVSHVDKNCITATLTRGTLTDTAAGIDVRNMRLQADIDKTGARLRNISIRLPNSEVNIGQADFDFPDKRQQRDFAYRADDIEGDVLLQDIAYTFAPILKSFTLPLHVKTRMNGDQQSIHFNDITVNTLDQQLQVEAEGHLTNLRNKYELVVAFHVDSLLARGNSKQKMIDQFPVKKLMMDQVDALGTISYKGDFRVLWKKEEFEGLLCSRIGNLDFNFALDEKNKYITGRFFTDSLHLGEAFDVKHLGNVGCRADFKMDFAKARTATMRTIKGGLLPIGEAHAEVTHARYKRYNIRNLHAEARSNGAVAHGRVERKGRNIDLVATFNYLRTQLKKKIKVKPGIRLHKAFKKRVNDEAIAPEPKARVLPHTPHSIGR